MFNDILLWFSFFKLIFREGSLKAQPLDFNTHKTRVLSGLGIPKRWNNSGFQKIKQKFLSVLINYPVLWNIVQNAVYIKNAILRPDYRFLKIDALQLIYFRVPKAASTSQLAALLKKMDTGLIIENLNATQVDVLAGSHLENRLPETKGNYFKYGIVRNPFARLVSVYLAYFQGYDGIENYNSNKVFFNYKNYLFGIFKYDDSFATFIKKITCIPDCLREQHIKAQYRLLGCNKFKDVHWLKLENLAWDFEEIKACYQLEIPIINQNPKYDYKSFYDKDLAIMVYNNYREDVEYFGYQQEFEELIGKK